jgi:MFS family permease
LSGPRYGSYAAAVSSLRAAFASLEVRDFRFLWLGMVFGHVGFWMQFVAQGWLAYDLTGSATFLGLVSAAGGVPGILLMLPAGVIADRFARRGVLVWTNAAMAGCHSVHNSWVPGSSPMPSH